MQITRYRGDTSPDKILISKDGAAQDLTGCTVYMTLNTKKNPTDTVDQVYQLIASVPTPLNGIAEFAPDSSQADRVGLFYYDIQVTDVTGAKITVAKDVYQYIQDITKN